MNNIKISLKMKNKGYLTVRKFVLKTRKIKMLMWNINILAWFDLVTPWDVLVFKAGVFSTDMDQIIAAQPSLQGYFVVVFSMYLKHF